MAKNVTSVVIPPSPDQTVRDWANVVSYPAFLSDQIVQAPRSGIKEFFRPMAYAVANRLRVILQNAERARLIRTLKSCGKNPSLYMPVVIEGAENVVIGDDVAMAPFVHIWGQGGIRIGNRVMIGSHCAISTLTHDYRERNMKNTLLSTEILIEDDVWIGGHCVIMRGITVGKGAVVGGGSVVTKNVEPYAIVIGAPAKLLRYRPVEETS